jgi:hypothetical protein
MEIKDRCHTPAGKARATELAELLESLECAEGENCYGLVTDPADKDGPILTIVRDAYKRSLPPFPEKEPAEIIAWVKEVLEAPL